jgi:DNA-binding response OmpR family regulator
MAHIAVIEDESDIAGLLAHCLAREGFNVTTAGDGEAGLDLVRLHHPDLVILDLLLPRLNGWEVFRHLRSHQATAAIPVVILTANARPEDRRALLEAGAEDYIVKPCSVKEVIARLRAILRRTERAPTERRQGA